MEADASPTMAAFNADLDRSFGAEFEAAGLDRQREIYDLFWRRHHASRPAGVKTRDYEIQAGDGARIPARLYWCDPRPQPGPLCLYFHGGGWAFGSIDSHDLVTSRLAAMTGTAILSVDYRLAPEHKHPDPLRDCWDAFNWAHRQADGLAMDSSRIGVAGDSAGAALAAGVALMSRDGGGPRVHHQALFYPVLSARPPTAGQRRGPGLDQSAVALYLRLYLRDEAQARDPYAMPLEAADLGGLPPALVLVATEDILREQGQDYIKRLLAGGIGAELIEAEGMPHSFLRIIHLEPRAAGYFGEFCRKMASAYGQPIPESAMVGTGGAP
jgi:acetyl esterase